MQGEVEDRVQVIIWHLCFIHQDIQTEASNVAHSWRGFTRQLLLPKWGEIKDACETPVGTSSMLISNEDT